MCTLCRVLDQFIFIYGEDKSALQSISVIIVHCCWNVSCGVGVVLYFDMLCDINGELRSANSAHTDTHVFVTFHERRIIFCIWSHITTRSYMLNEFSDSSRLIFLMYPNLFNLCEHTKKMRACEAHNNPRVEKICEIRKKEAI